MTVNELDWLRVKPELVGLSGQRLDRISDALRRDVLLKKLAGAISLVYRRGRIAHLAAMGFREAGSGAPMTLDSIFRIYSMTKPVTIVAAMSLCEEGRMSLHDPVARYLPELADRRVAVRTAGQIVATEPAKREMTVRDLMVHTSGIIGGYRGDPVMLQLYERAGIEAFDHIASAYRLTSAELVRALATIPLSCHPGTTWEYGRSGDVLGRLIEVVSGQGLEKTLAERVFEPLHMVDTGFFVPKQEAARIAQPLSPFTADVPMIDLTSRPAFISGGSGGFSTVGDFFRFAQMLLGGGELDGKRVLTRASVELMTSDRLDDVRGTGPDYIPGNGYGFGLGVAVRQQGGGPSLRRSAGEFWWLGRASTCFFVDPAEELVGLLMLQSYNTARFYQDLFKTLVYQALVD
ncbi:MAG TPA: serine hydrolase domain-containing protein [Mycobacterium sp.]|nr:serine hydrolase domain-containing protein [Mycobacterium sp.]